MTEAELRSFKRQLGSAQRWAASRGLVVYGYHWRDGHLDAMTKPISRPVAPPEIRETEGRVARRGAIAAEQARLL